MSEERGLTPAEKTRLAYNASIRLLARRDHSVAELNRKLRQREHDQTSIDSCMEELIDANYVNDRRYAELYVEQRIEKGFGPLAIRAKLYERGIDSSLTRRAFEVVGADWTQLATHLIHKRFNAEDIVGSDQRTIARIVRFVQGRGFNAGDVARALKEARKDLKDG